MFTHVVRLVFIFAVLGSVATRVVGEESAESEPFKPDAGFWLDAARDDLDRGLNAEAIRAATEAIHLKSGVGYLVRAEARLRMDDMRRGFDDLNTAIEVEDDKEIRAAAFELRAGIQVRFNRFEEAIADSAKALEFDQNSEGALLARTVALVKLNQYDSAIADCDRLVELDPKCVEYYQWRSMCRCEKKDWEKAVPDAVKVIELRPKEPKGYSLRAQAYAINEQYRLAIVDVKRAAELCKDDDLTFVGLVCMLVSCPDKRFNEYGGAVELVRDHCKATKWKNCLWISLLASVYAEAGDFSQAVEYGQKALSLATDEDRELAEHNLQLFKEGKTLNLANENLWTDAETLRR